jgi:hypothetical protein
VSEVRTASIIRAMRLHGAVYQEAVSFILADVRTWNLTYLELVVLVSWIFNQFADIRLCL